MLKTFDTLYKRTRTGDIQFWTVQVSTGEYPIIDKWSGKFGTTKPLHHTEQVNEGKQKRTPQDQAISMALSDWNKKRDEGYKSLEDLGIESTTHATTGEFLGYISDELQMGFKPDELGELLEKVMPEFNTDASGEMKPMLAPNKCWEANGKTKYPKQGEIKKDGLRSTIVMDPDRTVVLSRSGKPYDKMLHLVKILEAVYPRASRTKKFILDGELYVHGLSLQGMNEAVRGENEYTDKMEFWVYDLPTIEQPQAYRTTLVADFVNYTNNHADYPEGCGQFFNYHSAVTLNSDAEVLAYHDDLISQSFEGAMLKDPAGAYQPGQRSKFWSKVKMFEDNEYIVTGHVLGQRGVQDLMFWCDSKGGPFKVVMNGTLKEKEKLYAKVDSLVGKKLTVRHFGYTEYNVPNLGKGKAFREKEDLS